MGLFGTNEKDMAGLAEMIARAVDSLWVDPRKPDLNKAVGVGLGVNPINPMLTGGKSLDEVLKTMTPKEREEILKFFRNNISERMKGRKGETVDFMEGL